jgi:hypothetical protein
MLARIACLALPLLFAAHAAARPAPPVPKRYDLRGPALKKGLVLVVSTTSEMKDADADTVSGEGVVNRSKASGKLARELKYELLAVEGRVATRQRLTFNKATLTSTMNGVEGKVPLGVDGKAFLCEQRAGGKWKVKLDKGSGDHMTDSLEKVLTPWAPGDDWVPAERVAVGATWWRGSKALQDSFSEWGRLKDAKGRLRGKLRAVQKYRGEPCAVIDVELTIKGRTQVPGLLPMDVDVTSKVTIYRSLETGINLKAALESRFVQTTDEGALKQATGTQKTEILTTVKGR